MGDMEKYFDLINSLADSGIADERDIVNFIDRAGAGLKVFGQALKTPAPLVVPGMGYRGLTYVVETLRVRAQATSRSGRLVRLDAKIGLLEAPITGGLFSAIGLAVSIGAAALAPALRK